MRSTNHELLVTLSSPLPCHLVPLTPKYIPQHIILERPKPWVLQTKFHTYTKRMLIPLLKSGESLYKVECHKTETCYLRNPQHTKTPQHKEDAMYRRHTSNGLNHVNSLWEILHDCSPGKLRVIWKVIRKREVMIYTLYEYTHTHTKRS